MARRTTGLRRNAQRVVERRNHLAEGNDRLKARVDLLTTALTGLVEANDASTDQLPRSMWSALTRARAVLSATPTPTQSETP
jgi:hypothetical protein